MCGVLAYESGSAKLVTCDQNLQLKAGVEGWQTIPREICPLTVLAGFASVVPTPSMKYQQFLLLLCSTIQDSPRRPISPISPTSRLPPRGSPTRTRSAPKSRTPKHAPHVSANTQPAKIIVDQDLAILPPHPLSVLHDQVRAYLIRELPGRIEAGIAHELHRQEMEAKEDRNISIHARPKRAPPIPIPEEEWRNWSPEESILWLDKVLPPLQKLPAGASQKLADFIRPYGETGGRKGENWGRGEWTDGRVSCPS